MEILGPILFHSLPSPSSSTPSAPWQISGWHASLPLPWYEFQTLPPRINCYISERAILQHLSVVCHNLKWLAAVQSVLRVHLRNLETEIKNVNDMVDDMEAYDEGCGNAASDARAKGYLKAMWPAERDLMLQGKTTSWMKARVYCVKWYLSYVEIAERVMLERQV